MSLEHYLDRVREGLAGQGAAAERPLAEIREHLRDRVQDLVAEGLTLQQAEVEAIERFGDVEAVVSPLVTLLQAEGDPMERALKIISFMTLFTSVFGLAATALLNPTAELLTMTALVSAVSIGGAYASMRRGDEPGWLVITGSALLAIGGAGILWALLGGRTSAEPQIGLALLMAIYLVQGVLATWTGVRRYRVLPRSPSAA